MLRAGFAKTQILHPGEAHLIGLYSRRPRVAVRVRDPLWARALALSDGAVEVVLVACDLLCVSEELHRAVGAAVPELGPERLVLAGTHTHSSYGGFFTSSATAAMLGAHRPEVFAFLKERLVEMIQAARGDLAPARALAGCGQVPGLTASRRQADGPHDDRVSLLRLERPERRPIDLVACSGHPVVVSERDPALVSADYPGRLCERLEQAGCDPLFFSAALGGVSILFPEFHMDLERHLDLLGGLLCEGHTRAVGDLRPVAAGRTDQELRVDWLHVAHSRPASRIFSSLGSLGRLADGLLKPALGKLEKASSRALPNPAGVPVHLVRLGDFGLVASAAELGVGLVLALRQALELSGVRCALAISLADGYAGYTHLPQIYQRWPEKGYRFMALYENALGLFGHDLGARILEAVAARLS